MKRFNWVIALPVIALLPLVLVTGCVTRAIREKQAQVCGDLATLNNAIGVLRQVSSASTSTVNAVRQAEERVTTAFIDFRETVRNAPDEVKEVKIDELEQAYTDLDQAVKEIPDKSTIKQAIVLISDNLETMESVLGQTKAGLRCP